MESLCLLLKAILVPLIILLTLRMIDVAITILIMEKCYDLFYWRRWVRQLPNKPGNDYHSATQQKYFRENHYLLINIFARRRPFAIKKRLSSSQKKILSLRLSLISSFYVETINKRRKSPRKWIIICVEYLYQYFITVLECKCIDVLY